MKQLIIMTLLFASFWLSTSSAIAGETELKRSISDNWIGYIDAPGRKLPMEIDLSKLASDDQATLILTFEGGVQIDFEAITWSSDTLVLDALNGQMSFLLNIAESSVDEITGLAANRGAEFPLRLARAETPAHRSLKDSMANSQSPRAEFIKKSSDTDEELVSEENLGQLVDAADRTNSSSLVIFKKGQLIGEWHRDDQALAIESMSVTKAILNLVVGRLVTLKLLDVEMHVGAFFPEEADWQTAPKGDITVRHLLTHTSGLEPGVPTHDLYASGDFVSFALNADVEESPGTVVSYNNTAANLLAAVAERSLTSSFEEFVADELFSKLGINNARWLNDMAGNPQGMAGLQITAMDLARLGQLALQRGEWEGEQLIAESWFEASFQSQTSDKPRVGVLEENPAEIGFLWFMLDEKQETGQQKTIFHTGHLGQFLVIRPENNLVAVRMIQHEDVRDPEADVFREFMDLVKQL